MQEMTDIVALKILAHRAYTLRRLGIVMKPDPGNQYEAGGVLNPGGTRAANGEYLLFPRLVAQGNYSRVGIASVVFDAAGVPVSVERRGLALEPEQPYEKNPRSGGGCEDPRVTHIASLGIYVMSYVAYGPAGPRAALAVSTDLYAWRRAGLINLAPYRGADMNIYGNKDVLLFPEVLPGPDGRPSLVMMHRPMYLTWAGKNLDDHRSAPPPPGITHSIWTVWLSYCALEDAAWATPTPSASVAAPTFDHHYELLLPEQPWEALRMGGGTPPVRLPEGWLTYYHGIGRMQQPGAKAGVRYVSGAMLLDAADPRRVLYRSPHPVLEPSLAEERSGVVADVVFPTAIDQQPTHLDVYYGMADACIGAARLTLREG